MSSPDDCPICLEACDSETSTTTECCKKVFHQACLDKWSGTCPTCREVRVVIVPPEQFPVHEIRIVVPSINWRALCVVFGILIGVVAVFGFLGAVIFAFVQRGISSQSSGNSTVTG